eukprot:562772-Amphidinium_carterae.1
MCSLSSVAVFERAAAIDVRDKDLVSIILGRLEAFLQSAQSDASVVDVSPRELANACWAIAKVRVPNQSLQNMICSLILGHLRRETWKSFDGRKFNAQELSNITWAMAVLSEKETPQK